jgi:hypothetical protein
MSPREVMGRCALKRKNCEAYAEWNYNTMGSDNFLYKSNQQTKSLTPMDKTDGIIMKSKKESIASSISGVKTEPEDLNV